MKATIAALTIVIFIITLTVTASLLSISLLNSVQEDISGISEQRREQSLSVLYSLKHQFGEKITVLTFTLTDREKEELDVLIGEGICALEQSDAMELNKVKSHLLLKLEKTKRLLGFNLESIF